MVAGIAIILILLLFFFFAYVLVIVIGTGDLIVKYIVWCPCINIPN